MALARTLFDEEHDMFRESVRKFVKAEMAPYHEQWEAKGIMPKEVFLAAGELGILGVNIPEEYGGGGMSDFRFNMIVNEEIQAAGVMSSGLGITLHTDVCLPYLLKGANEEQMARWLPGCASGELVLAIAMTEPGAGSDLAGMSTSATADGDEYVVNGSKTFITNGINSGLIITAVKTDPKQKHKGMSIIGIEEDTPGFSRGRNLSKIGLKAQDTAELFFTDCRVPMANLLREEGTGFGQLVEKLPQERLSLAIGAVGHAEAAFGWTCEYVRERKAFGIPVGGFQNTRFRLAEMRTELDIAWVFLDRCVQALNDGSLSAEDAAEAKWWCSDMEGRVTDGCLQLHGGYGFMTEYPISKAWTDARVQRIYGGTNEIMKEIIGRGLDLA